MYTQYTTELYPTVLWKGISFLHTKVFIITFLQKHGIITQKYNKKWRIQFFLNATNTIFTLFLKSYNQIVLYLHLTRRGSGK